MSGGRPSLPSWLSESPHIPWLSISPFNFVLCLQCKELPIFNTFFMFVFIPRELGSHVYKKWPENGGLINRNTFFSNVKIFGKRRSRAGLLAPGSSEMQLSVFPDHLRCGCLSSCSAIFYQVIVVRWRIRSQLSHRYNKQEVKKEDYQLEKLPVQVSFSRPHPLHTRPRIETNWRAVL